MRHVPSFSEISLVCIGHSHDVSSRTGTRLILQMGHEPGFASTTSGCMGHVIDNRGRDLVRSVDGVPARCAPMRAASNSSMQTDSPLVSPTIPVTRTASRYHRFLTHGSSSPSIPDSVHWAAASPQTSGPDRGSERELRSPFFAVSDWKETRSAGHASASRQTTGLTPLLRSSSLSMCWSVYALSSACWRDHGLGQRRHVFWSSRRGVWRYDADQ